jgi:hypothetical protein
MPKGPEKSSHKAQPRQASRSVYDFFYQDARRVGSLLAQFHPEGLLQSIRRTDSVTVEDSSGEAKEAGGTAGIVKGKMAFADASSQSSVNSSERAYDPLWQNAIALLTFLQNQAYLQRTLEEARIGQTILISGELEVFDMGLLIALFSEAQSIKRMAHLFDSGSGNPKPTPQNKTTAEKIEAVAKLLGRFPIETQAVLRTSKSSVWCSLKSDSLEATFTSIFLKYGSRVSGTWSMLAILDCFPDDPESTRIKSPSEEVTSLLEIYKRLDLLSRHVGRPNDAHGVTPILIFREVELASS